MLIQTIVQEVCLNWLGDVDYALVHGLKLPRVNHARLRDAITEHPVDLSKNLEHLTQAGLLESTGGRR